MELYDVVTKLIGPVDPAGETQADGKRFENLKVMTDLVEKLVADISRVEQNKHRHEFSMKRAGQHAAEFLDSLGVTE